MVQEKNKDTEFDFSTQGIELVKDGNFLKAKGTTLGADNGIAVAYALAILDSDEIKHPALEIVITTDEEEEMSGVNNLNFAEFDGKTLINLDTEEYGEVYVSSAGRARTETKFIFEIKKIGKDYTPVSIEVKGLSGGHSGAQIHENLGNSMLSWVLRTRKVCPFDLKILPRVGGRSLRGRHHRHPEPRQHPNRRQLF